jgi:hypothetical protein
MRPDDAHPTPEVSPTAPLSLLPLLLLGPQGPLQRLLGAALHTLCFDAAAVEIVQEGVLSEVVEDLNGLLHRGTVNLGGDLGTRGSRTN